MEPDAPDRARTRHLRRQVPTQRRSRAWLGPLVATAIFATAMIAIRATGLTGNYARYSHLLGGVVLLTIGAVMALRPDLLAFS